MPWQGLRDFLAGLQAAGELLTVEEEVDPAHEMAAVWQEAAGGPAVLFRRVRGYPGARVVGNLLGTRRRAALALDLPEEELTEGYLARRRTSLAPCQVKKGAPVQEVVYRGTEADVLRLLPAPTFHAGDAGPYLTAGVLLARDPAGGAASMGIHRLQVKGPRRLGVFLATPPLADFQARAEKDGQALPVAVALGADPACLLAAVLPAVADGTDKLAAAGGLAGRPLALASGLTVDVPVPAGAEIVLEGQILPGVREEEGPFGESTGYYFRNRSQVLEVTVITTRPDPVLPAIHPWGPELDVLLSLGAGSELYARLRQEFPALRAVNFVPGTCTFIAVLAVRDLPRGEVRRLMALALALSPRWKEVIVVDDDVDPFDLRQVWWALATRCRPESDLLLLPGMSGYAIDPSAAQGGSKLGLDATRHGVEEMQKVSLPPAALARGRAIWRALLEQEGRSPALRSLSAGDSIH